LKRKSLLIGLGIVLVVALVAVNLVRDFEKAEAVEVEIAERRDLEAVVSASGWLEAHRKMDVSANTLGKIVQLNVAEGDHVALGDVLLEIDPVPYRAEVDQMRAQLRRSRAELDAALATQQEAADELARLEAARRASTVREIDAQRRARERADAVVVARRAEVEQGEAALENARHRFEQVTVVAEMAGVVTRLNVEEGENVVTGTMNNPGTVLMTISDLTDMEVRLEVDETDVVALELGMPAEVWIDAFPDSTFSGTVREIGHAPIRRGGRAGESTADFEVIVRLDRSQPRFRPGLSASADIVTATRDDALAVSLGSLVLRDPTAEPVSGDAPADSSGATDDADDRRHPRDRDVYGVYVVDGDRTAFRRVTVGITGARHVEILDGLTEGAQVVAGPHSLLRRLESGVRVKVESPDERS